MSTGNFGHGVMFILLMVVLGVSNATVIIVSLITGNYSMLFSGISFLAGFWIGWYMKKYKQYLMD